MTTSERPIDIPPEWETGQLVTSTVGLMLGSLIFALLTRNDNASASTVLWISTMWSTAAVLCGTGLILRTSIHTRWWERVFLGAHAVVGTLWGVAMVMNTERNERYALVTLVLFMANTAGARGTASSSLKIELSLLGPLWIIGTTALLFQGFWVLAFGSICFPLLIANSFITASRTFARTVALQQRAADLAERLGHDAGHDMLTGLPNRAGFSNTVTEIAGHMEPAGQICLLFVDLDFFKEVNDTFGHLVGDEVLATVSTRIVAHTSGTAIAGRLGGDEFVVAVFNQPRLDVETLAVTIISSLEVPINTGGREVRISASIGLAEATGATFDLSRLLANADFALYEAKQRGRRQMALFGDERRQPVARVPGIENALRRAVALEELEVFAQPIMALPERLPRAIELLCRWTGPSGDPVSPEVFIPLAEELGLIADIDRMMLAHAAQTLSEWRMDPMLCDVMVGINVSARHLCNEGLVQDVATTLARFQAPAELLVIELTESQVVSDTAQARRNIIELTQLGCQVVMDDFGTGYSSLANVVELPITSVKIDRGFIAQLGTGSQHIEIVRLVADMALRLGLTAIAEGVETQQQEDALLAAGITRFQGFRYARPIPLAEVGPLMRAMIALQATPVTT